MIEKLVLTAFADKRVIRLYQTFQDKQNLYFLLEIAEKGDLGKFIS